VVAERNGKIVGWVSGYRPPSHPDNFFVWQVAVAEEARGQRLGQRMIQSLLERPAAQGVSHLITTVTLDNQSSWAMFKGLAERWGAALEKTALFDREIHFAGAHDTEWQARIGPLPLSLASAVQKEQR
jgi:L-2,4-diaminobutyric acid acetyltransferase